ncbi:Nmd5p [Sugiyamaella lignohabitans]|uniref:Nmd5p n=1 Tax=Sugiyamaella lignohabitans TaxID=796027 RepID=A0A167DGY9_9ASCO|nr:Nmd5p [Sugiyamaella lignohabitans]ANB12906.1 Nmd5p [Sugiyamaella lignohabitans]
MDINALHNCFAATLDADINNRRRAELELKEANKAPGFINGCLDIVLEPQVSNGVKAAAAVYLKNRVSGHWMPYDKNATDKIDEGEKPVFRERIIPALIKVSPPIRPVLVSILNSIVSYDYPKQWPELLDVTLKLFQNNDVDSIRCGLTCLLEVARYYRWTSGESRVGLDGVIEIAFAGVLSVGNSLVNENNAAAGEMLRDVLKIYKMASYVSAEPHSLCFHSSDARLERSERSHGVWGGAPAARGRVPPPQKRLELELTLNSNNCP